MLTNDTDPDAGDTLVVVAVNGSTVAVGQVVATTHGTVTVNPMATSPTRQASDVRRPATPSPTPSAMDTAGRRPRQ